MEFDVSVDDDDSLSSSSWLPSSASDGVAYVPSDWGVFFVGPCLPCCKAFRLACALVLGGFCAGGSSRSLRRVVRLPCTRRNSVMSLCFWESLMLARLSSWTRRRIALKTGISCSHFSRFLMNSARLVSGLLWLAAAMTASMWTWGTAYWACRSARDMLRRC